MAEKLLMIALSPTMSEGTIAKWKVAEGAAFVAGDVLCEVETDKASMDYEAPRDAVLLKILLPEGGRASVGDPIAVIGAAGEDPGPAPVGGNDKGAAVRQESPAQAASAPASGPDQAKAMGAAGMPRAPRFPEAQASPGSRNASTAAEAQAGSSGAIRAPGPALPASYPPSSPLARSLARDLGLDLRAARGSGPGGRVVERDVRALAEGRPGPEGAFAAGQGAPGSGLPAGAGASTGPRRVPVTGKRAVIARRLSESFFTAPHYYLKRRADAGALLRLREAVNSGRDKPISLNAFIVKLAAEAIARHPYVNSSWEGDTILERSSIDIGLAVALPDGLITPVVRDCGSKLVAAIDEELSALIAKAKEGRLRPEEYEGAGFTISNLGSFGVEEFTAIINPPGSAILALGAALDEPYARGDGTVGIRKAFALTLGCDHRVIDGAAGARFLATLVSLVQEPGKALV